MVCQLRLPKETVESEKRANIIWSLADNLCKPVKAIRNRSIRYEVRLCTHRVLKSINL
ncbi:hypothetical protein QWZ13_10565 [Reinekea marina]|uniref:hypothetical protein n=1 Tax=Reinekea marina TaxID=1310421 RepID=UPI0025B3CD40|nr:hypothetical protein [Reinekea marina]MDN3649353.1 hypothetical protein [Reinekea marina]